MVIDVSQISIVTFIFTFLLAISMHEMNREMKLLRQQMEQKLRKELVRLYLV
jgi:predicted amino acid-binding ACT domain protein